MSLRTEGELGSRSWGGGDLGRSVTSNVCKALKMRLTTWTRIPSSCRQCGHIVRKVVIHPKLICQCNASPSRLPKGSSMEFYKLILKQNKTKGVVNTEWGNLSTGRQHLLWAIVNWIRTCVSKENTVKSLVENVGTFLSVFVVRKVFFFFF